MYGLFSRSRRALSGNRRRRAFLAVERLETRYCPAGPAITGLTATTVSGNTVTLSGTVSDNNPGPVTLTFNGVASGSTTAGSNGSFTWTGNASQLGAVTAVATDSSMQSPTAQVQVKDGQPILNMNVTITGSGNHVRLSGSVTDLAPGGLTVKFTGVVNGSTVTDANGNFSVVLSASSVGNVQGTVTNGAGQTSNAATGTVAPTPPEITYFGASHPYGNTWIFSGSVAAGVCPAGMTVQLGGLTGLQGQTATVQADGTFSITVTLQPGDDGTATAITTDPFGQQSNMAGTTVGP